MSLRLLLGTGREYQRCCCRTNPIRPVACDSSRRMEGLPKHTGKESYQWNVKKIPRAKFWQKSKHFHQVSFVVIIVVILFFINALISKGL